MLLGALGGFGASPVSSWVAGNNRPVIQAGVSAKVDHICLVRTTPGSEEISCVSKLNPRITHPHIEVDLNEVLQLMQRDDAL
jgi:hypothetical protein